MKICDELDCSLHPDYVQAVHEKPTISHLPKISDLGGHIHGDTITWGNLTSSTIPTIRSMDSSVSAENSVKFKTKYITCHIECCFCQHRKNIDMKKEIIVANAKQLLQE